MIYGCSMMWLRHDTWEFRLASNLHWRREIPLGVGVPLWVVGTVLFDFFWPVPFDRYYIGYVASLFINVSRIIDSPQKVPHPR